MRVKIVALVLLMLFCVSFVSAVDTTVKGAADAAKKAAGISDEDSVESTAGSMMNNAIMAIAALVIIAGGVYLGLKMYHKNYPPADNAEKK